MKTIKNNIYITALALFFATCGSENKENSQQSEMEHNHHQEMDKEVVVTTKQFINANMKLGVLQEFSFGEGIKVTGTIDVPPRSKAVITSFVAGRVKISSLLIGDKVKKGQALITIENISFIELQQSYLEVSEQIEYLKSEYDRQKQLYDEKIASQKVYLKAQSDYKTMLSRYLGLKKKLELLNINITDVENGKITSSVTIFSPINGRISQLNVNSGSYVNPTDEIMEIINTDHIHVELNVFEKDIMKVKKGQKIRFKVSESSNKLHEAEVHLVGTSINSETRTVKVHGHLNEEDQEHFLAGMFVDAEILITDTKKTGVPERAIIETEGKKSVLILKNKANNEYTFKEKEVETGELNNGFVEILNITDFNSKDSLLTQGGYSLIGKESGGHSH